MTKILGLIPARKNSKRVLNKNTRILGDKPLLAWTIQTAKDSDLFSDILVSTDSNIISDIAISYGARSPWLRENYLSRDETKSIDVVLDIIKKLEKENNVPDAILLLQPTSPFRSINTILRAIETFKKNKLKSVVSFTKSKVNPEWCFRISNNSINPLMGWSNYDKRSQNIQSTYELNGLIYLATPNFLKKNKSFLNSQTIPLIVDDGIEVLDIDTEEDFNFAEKILRKNFTTTKNTIYNK